jgi:hypothetical protein
VVIHPTSYSAIALATVGGWPHKLLKP